MATAVRVTRLMSAGAAGFLDGVRDEAVAAMLVVRRRRSRPVPRMANRVEVTVRRLDGMSPIIVATFGVPVSPTLSDTTGRATFDMLRGGFVPAAAHDAVEQHRDGNQQMATTREQPDASSDATPEPPIRW